MTSTAEPPHIFLDIKLTPHRSLSKRGFCMVMLGVCAFSAVISTGLFLAGAWPVFGFLGLDVLLVYLAFRTSYRRARVAETLRLDDQVLLVERTDVRGTCQGWRFEPTWVRIEVPDPVRPSAGIVLRTHAESLTVGSFLGFEARLAVAKDLTGALTQWRNRPFPV